LTISRDLTRFLQCGNDLEVLILRGPADTNHHSSMSSLNGGGGGSGIPTYLIGMLQDLILSKPDWKKIELSGKTPYATERILQRTMILRKDATTASGVSENRRNPKALVKHGSSSYNNDVRNSGYVEDIQKLVIEHATVPILDTVSSILGAKTALPSPSSVSSSSLESSIVGTTTIHTLALRWTELSISSVQALARGLVTQSPTYATTISPYQPLQSLFLTGSTVDDDAIPLLAEALQACTLLEELSLTDCHLEDEQAACIITALHEKDHPKLQSLDVSCNFVQSKATASLSQLVKQRSRLINSATDDSSLASLPLLAIDISNQDVWDDRNYLQSLFDSLTGIERGSSVARSRILSTSVRSIDLSDNFIQDSHIHSLCECFSMAAHVGTRVNLQKMVLRGNSITDDGVKTIAESLPAMQHLHDLDLRLNQNISEEGVEAITLALQHLHVNKTQKSEPSNGKDVAGATILNKDIADKSTSGKSLWHIRLDEPSEAFMMALVLHRAGRSRLLLEEERHNSTLPISLWPLIFERSKRCVQPDIDSFDEEISIHGITQVDLVYELFRTGQPFFWDNLTTKQSDYV
jgi:hypothetical protein